MGIKAVDSHTKSEKHRKSIATCDKKLSEESDFDSELRVGGRCQCYTGGSIIVEDIRYTFPSTETLKVELLWTLQTMAKAKHQSYHCVQGSHMFSKASNVLGFDLSVRMFSNLTLCSQMFSKRMVFKMPLFWPYFGIDRVRNYTFFDRPTTSGNNPNGR